MTKQLNIPLLSDEEIIKRAKQLDNGCGIAQLVKATPNPIMNGCDIVATVVHDKIIRWSLYHNDEFAMRFKTCKEAIDYLLESEI